MTIEWRLVQRARDWSHPADEIVLDLVGREDGRYYSARISDGVMLVQEHPITAAAEHIAVEPFMKFSPLFFSDVESMVTALYTWMQSLHGTHLGDAESENKVLREWLAKELGRVDRQMFS